VLERVLRRLEARDQAANKPVLRCWRTGENIRCEGLIDADGRVLAIYTMCETNIPANENDLRAEVHKGRLVAMTFTPNVDEDSNDDDSETRSCSGSTLHSSTPSTAQPRTP